MVKETIARFGRVDVLHNNHAWLMDNMPNDRTVVDTPFEVWDRTMAVNLRGYFAAAKYAVPHMIAPGGISEEHPSELQSLMRISYVYSGSKKKTKHTPTTTNPQHLK